MSDASDPTPAPRHRLGWKKKLLLALGGGLAGLLIAEAVLRIVGYSAPLLYAPDPMLGSRLQANFAARFNREGDGWVETNAHGWRDRDHALEKPPGVFRIAVLGDSYVEALQVDQPETFWAVLETELNARRRPDDPTVEVLAFGSSGYGTPQELLVLREEAAEYSPDLVLLAFVPGNDVQNNSRDLEPYRVRPFYTLNEGKLTLDDSFTEHADYQKAGTGWVRFKVAAINYSRVLQALNAALHPRPPETSAGEPGLGIDWLREPTDDDWRHAWAVTEALLTEMQTVCRDELSAPLVVATVSTGIQVDPDPAMRQAALDRWSLDDFLYAERRIAALGQQTGFEVALLIEPLRAYAESNDVHLHGFANTQPGVGHWNTTGHRLAGEQLVEVLLPYVRGDASIR